MTSATPATRPSSSTSALEAPGAALRLTYVGHACIAVDVGGLRILMDPWLCDSSQYHAWWHLPPLTLSIEQLLPIDYIMISHVHDDHFHPPSLAQLPKTATVVIPYGLDTWMRDAVRAMGFARVMELEHGRTYRLRQDLQVSNFQCGRIDSAYWLSHPEGTVLNLNDCPVAPHWLKHWFGRRGRPDIALGAFSYASPYPVCYELPGVDRRAEANTSNQRILRQFASTMETLQPRYAVPFATQYGFFAPEQLWMNHHLPTPVDALAALRTYCPAVEGVLLNPGDRLCPREGPAAAASGFDWSRRDAAVAEIAARRAAEVQRALDEEPAPPKDLFERFAAYFRALIGKNWLLRRRITVPIAIVTQEGAESWVIDCRRSAAELVTRQPSGAAPIEIHLPAAALSAAIRGEVHWETVYLSNRLCIRTAPELLDQEWTLWRMLFNFPQGMLRDRLRFATPRGLRILWRRRDEMARLVLERLTASSQREPFHAP